MRNKNTKTVINIKTEKSLRDDAKKTAESMGIPLSTAINAFLKQFVREKELTLSANTEVPTPYLQRVISEAKKEYSEGNAKGPLSGREFAQHLKKL